MRKEGKESLAYILAFWGLGFFFNQLAWFPVALRE